MLPDSLKQNGLQCLEYCWAPAGAHQSGWTCFAQCESQNFIFVMRLLHIPIFFFFKVAKTSEEALKLFVSVWCNKHRMWSPSWGFRCYWVFSCFVLPCACGSSRCLSALLCFLSLRDTLLLSEDHRGPDGFWMDCFMTVSPLIFAAKVAAEDREGGGGSYRGGGAIKATLKRRRTDL